MRLAVLAILAFSIAVPVGWAGGRPDAGRPAAGTLSIEGARAAIVIRGAGTVVGRVAKGDVQILDLSPNDAWTPKINGIAKGRTVQMRGRDINFFIPGGRYRLSVRGDGASLSARGLGVVQIKSTKPGESTSGTIAVGDASATALPGDGSRVVFGGGE